MLTVLVVVPLTVTEYRVALGTCSHDRIVVVLSGWFTARPTGMSGGTADAGADDPNVAATSPRVSAAAIRRRTVARRVVRGIPEGPLVV